MIIGFPYHLIALINAEAYENQMKQAERLRKAQEQFINERKEEFERRFNEHNYNNAIEGEFVHVEDEEPKLLK